MKKPAFLDEGRAKRLPLRVGHGRGKLEAFDGDSLIEAEVVPPVNHAKASLAADVIDAVFAIDGRPHPAEEIHQLLHRAPRA
jgi:hypothetical protein